MNERGESGEVDRRDGGLTGTLWAIAAVIAVYELVLFAALRAYAG